MSTSADDRRRGVSMTSRDPLQPIDLGLPSLGMLMHLVAAVATGVGVTFVVGVLILREALHEDSVTLPALGIVALGMVRAWMQARAADALVARSPTAPARVGHYLVTSVAATIAMGPLAARVFPSAAWPTLVLGLGATLLWPITVASWGRRRAVRQMFEAARAFDVPLVPRDRSIEGIGVTMLVLAPIGLGYGVLLVILALGRGDVLMIGVATALTARSLSHLRLGLLAADGTPPWVFPNALRTYSGLGWLSTLVVGGMVVAIAPEGYEGHAVAGGVALALALLGWPRTVSRFADRALAEEQTLRGVPFGVAPDRGLVSLGFLLIGLAVAELTVWLVELAIGQGLPRGLGSLIVRTSPSDLVALLPLAAKVWAGVTLVRMRGYRIAVWVYGGVAIVTAVVGWIMTGFELDDLTTGPLGLVGAALGLVVPVASVVLVRRRLPPPERVAAASPVPARARASAEAKTAASSVAAPAKPVAAPRPALAMKAAPQRVADASDVMATLACTCGWHQELPRVFALGEARCGACGERVAVAR